MAGSRPGRAPKGTREPRTVRLPVDHLEHYLELAERAELSFGDWVTEQLALAQGLRPPEYLDEERARFRERERRRRAREEDPNQPRLPISA